MKDLNDKVVVITGGASGVGRALGVLFAQEGSKVVLVDINQQSLDKTVSELSSEGLSGIEGCCSKNVAADSANS